MEISKFIKQVRSGVAEIALERNRQALGNGTAFLVKGGLITNSHVIRPPGSIDAFRIRFDDSDEVIRLAPPDFYSLITTESTVNNLDYAYVKINEPELKGRFEFTLGNKSQISVGNEVLFLGYPFGMPQLTAHRGYVSSIHQQNNRDIIQIDGSVNGGNSGGPLIELETGNVIGIITRAVTGIVEKEFDNLISTLRQNQKILEQTGAVIQVGGVDPIQGLKASQAAMEQIAKNLKRSANVGIGYAFSIDRVKSDIK